MPRRVAAVEECDFCWEVDASYVHDCETFETLLSVTPAPGGWWACPGCHVLVEQHRWKPLYERAVLAARRKYPKMPDERVQRGVELIHGQFRRHMPVADFVNP